jgi:hypothetical protein
MELAREQRRFPDPVMDLAFKRVTDAWNFSRIPVDKANWGIARQQYLQESIPSLRQAIRLLNQALVMMP